MSRLTSADQRDGLRLQTQLPCSYRASQTPSSAAGLFATFGQPSKPKNDPALAHDEKLAALEAKFLPLLDAIKDPATAAALQSLQQQIQLISGARIRNQWAQERLQEQTIGMSFDGMDIQTDDAAVLQAPYLSILVQLPCSTLFASCLRRTTTESATCTHWGGTFVTADAEDLRRYRRLLLTS